MRLGILTSHPIQYQAPWFRALARRADVKVFFAHRQSAAEQGRAGFGVAFDWDVDLLSGYQNQFLKNISPNPDVNHFAGCDTPEIAEIIVREKFDAFIVNGWYLKSYRQAMRACRTARVPVLVRGDSQLATPRSPLKRLAMEFTQRRLLRQFDGFLTVGQRNREYLEHFGVPAGKIFFAPHFVDNKWFAAKAAEARGQRFEVRKGWGADEKMLVALFVGKFQAIKRSGDLLKAVALFRSRKSEVRSQKLMAVFVGSGELEQELRCEASRLGVTAHFTGFKNQSELPACYAAADVLVLPSESETWGLVVNEAMACGLPAIVSAVVGCAPDLIGEGATGFTFPVGNVGALAACLGSCAKMTSEKFNFPTATARRLERYSVAAAVEGTLLAAENCRRA